VNRPPAPQSPSGPPSKRTIILAGDDVPPTKFGTCKECLDAVRIDESTKVPGHEIWECQACGYPHNMSDFWEVWDADTEPKCAIDP